MKYCDGQDVRLGDRVKLGSDQGGIVVASIDTGQYGLIHYEEAEPDLQLVSRSET